MGPIPCIILFFLLLFFPGFAPQLWGQQFLYNNYSVKDGLPTSEVYDVLQDKKGYLWFATDGGVSRFDGYSFRNFTTQDGLPVNSVLKLFQDKKGRIWFTMHGEQPLAWFENDTIHTFPHNSTLAMLTRKNVICSFHVDEADNIYIGALTGGTGSIKITSWKGKVLGYKIEEKHAYGHFLYTVEDGCIFGKGTGMQKPVLHMDTPGGELEIPINDSINVTRVSGVRTGTDTICFATSFQVHLLTVNGTLLHVFDVPHLIHSLSADKRGYLWISTSYGAFRYNLKDLAEPPVHLLPHLLVSEVLIDSEGGAWLTTMQEGIFHLTPHSFHNYTVSQGLSGNKTVMLFPLDEKRVIVSTSGKGPEIIDIESKTVREIRGRDGESTGWCYTAGWLNLQKDTFFIGTGMIGVLFFDRSEHFLYRWKNYNSNMKAYVLTRTGKRIAAKGPQLGELHAAKTFLTPCCTRINAICEGSEGQIWCATIDGLYCYDNGTWESYGSQSPLLKLQADDVEERVPGELWIATRGQGVLIFKNGRVKQIRKKDGLIDDYCKALLFDSTGNTAWVGTNSGISRIRIKDDHFALSSFNESSGLVCDEVNVMCWLGNKLCIGTNKGVSIIDPDDLLSNTMPPPVYIRGISIQGNEVPLRSGFDLPYNRNYISIDFVGLGFKEPGKMQYRYKMDGIDSSWNYTAATLVQYPALPPGNYRFEVYAVNNDMVASAAPAQVEFNITPPWWRTWWFIASVTIGFAGFTLLFTFGRIRRVRRREQEKTAINKKLAEAQLTALRAQMNPHFIFNALGSIQNFVLTNDTEQANSYLVKFSSLIRRVLQNSADSYVSLEEEIKTLKLYIELEALRFSSAFDYEINVDEEIDTLQEIPSMIIQPYVENAIWHGLMHRKEKGKLVVHLMNGEEDESIVCVIEDNGIGRKAAGESRSKRQGHRSMGMLVTRERLGLLGHSHGSAIEITDLYDENDRPAGTRVRLIIAARIYSDPVIPE